MESNVTWDLDVGARPALPTLRIAEWIRALSPSVTEQERLHLLERVIEMLDLEALWTFAAVEDDLFVRDCAGAVPVTEETTAVLDLLLRRVGSGRCSAGGVRGQTVLPRGLRDARPLAVVFRDDGVGLVVAARLTKRSSLRSGELELFGVLAEALYAADLADRLEDRAEERFRRTTELRRRLDRLCAREIRDALDLVGGDRLAAAALVGVEPGRLTREMDRLDLV